MTESQDIFKPAPPLQPQDVESSSLDHSAKTKDVEEAPFVRPYGLFDPKKHRADQDNPNVAAVAEGEEVDEFGRSRPRGVKRQRDAVQKMRRGVEEKGPVDVGANGEEVTKEALNKLVCGCLFRNIYIYIFI